MSEPFRATRKVRFADCDPAGIAYYPRYFELCDGVVEDWCEEVLVPRRVLHLELGLALPTVDLRATFTAPSRLGDHLDISLNAQAIGRSSVQLLAEASCGGQARFTIQYTQVLMSMAEARAVGWPDDWRERIEAVLPQQASAAPGS
jgi:4-hydroxybenzoyl-CoA thioesterase